MIAQKDQIYWREVERKHSIHEFNEDAFYRAVEMFSAVLKKKVVTNLTEESEFRCGGMASSSLYRRTYTYTELIRA